MSENNESQVEKTDIQTPEDELRVAIQRTPERIFILRPLLIPAMILMGLGGYLNAKFGGNWVFVGATLYLLGFVLAMWVGLSGALPKSKDFAIFILSLFVIPAVCLLAMGFAFVVIMFLEK